MTERDPIVRPVDVGAVTEADRVFYQRLSARAAKGVAVVTARHGGWDHATVITDYLSVSYDPPSMLVSLYSLSRICEAIEESGRWSLSLLSAGQSAIADALAQPGAPLIGLLNHVPHRRRELAAPPVVEGALAWFELTTTAVHEAETHLLVVGEVTWMGHPAGVTEAPLVRFGSEYNRF